MAMLVSGRVGVFFSIKLRQTSLSNLGVVLQKCRIFFCSKSAEALKYCFAGNPAPVGMNNFQSFHIFKDILHHIALYNHDITHM